MLEARGGQLGALRPQLEALEQEVGRLKEWASGLTGNRAQLQTSMEALREAVGQIEGRTSSITVDFANKVSWFSHQFICQMFYCFIFGCKISEICLKCVL